MEMESIMGYLHEKTILITGATGLLGMVLVEKILRVQPDVRKLYLLIRPSKGKSATERMNEEITSKTLFKVLRNKWGKDFDSFVSQKVVALSGDVSSENLGLNKVMLEQVCSEIHIIINSAANTNFDDRYDISLGINTFGVLHLIDVSNKCIKLEMFLHISTAYVCGERGGVILEDFSSMEERVIDESAKISFEVLENNLVKEKLNELRTQNFSEEFVTKTMKEFGIERANLYGWPNTYVFTKVMGELILRRYLKKNLPFLIIRPPIVTSTYKEPFPGWIQGYRTIDSLIATYCKGKLTFIPFDPTSILDMMPVDMVVNSIIAAMVNAKNSYGTVYHVGSSRRNPTTYSDVYKFAFQYFTKYPWVNKNGNPIAIQKLTQFKNIDSFYAYMKLRYMLPLKVLEVVNILSGQYFKDVYDKNNKTLATGMRMVELYRPYLYFKGIFDDTNTEKLRRLTNECFLDAKSFNFDSTSIDWEDYFMHTHIPGLVEHVLKK